MNGKGGVMEEKDKEALIKACLNTSTEKNWSWINVGDGLPSRIYIVTERYFKELTKIKHKEELREEARVNLIKATRELEKAEKEFKDVR
jgi:hypothetical protein